MSKSVEKTGKTIDDAVQDALSELGVGIDEVVIDVLDEGDSGILGIGRKPARVLVTYDDLTLDVLPDDANLDTDDNTQYDYSEESLERAGENDPGMLNDAGFQEDLESELIAESTEDGLLPTDQEPVYFGDDEASAADGTTEDMALKALDYLEQIFAYMDIEAEFSYTREDDRILVDIEGEDVGAVIGHRGDTLNALQYLTSLVVNRESDKHLYLTVDISGYRKRRDKALTDMAKRTANRVIEVGKDFVMEPMTAAERRVIHTALQDYPGVRTESEGVEPRRSVVIIPSKRV